MTSPTRRGFLYGLTLTGGVAAGCSAAGTVTAQGTSIGDSRMEQYDATNTGFAPNERGPRSDLRELWRSDAGDALIGSAAVVDSVAYTADEAGTVRALDAVTGTEQWAVDLDVEIVTSPVIAGETVCVTAGESLYALTVSDGAKRWIETIGAAPSSPIVTDEMIFVAGGNTVHAFAPDGTAATAVDLTGEVVSTTAVDGSTLYAATDAGTVYAFDIEQSTGSVTLTEQWTTSTVIDRRPTVTVSGGILVVTGASPGEGEQGRVYALNADTGEDQWSFSTTRWIESAAAIDDDTVYVGGDNGDVVALAAESGAERWRFNANDSWSFLYWGPGVTGGLVVTDDTVYVGSEDNNLYAIDADTGAPQWRFPTGDAIVSTPTVVDGIAFVGNTDGALYSITSPETSPVPLDGAAGGAGVETEFDDSNTGDGGVLGFSLPNGLWGLVTSPVTLLVLAIGLLYGIVSTALNDSDGNDTASTGSAAEAQSTPAIYRGSVSSITAESDTEAEAPVESAGNVASGSPDEVRGESADDRDGESQRTELLDELRELDRKWSEIDRTLLYSVGDHHPDEYEDVFGGLDAALAAAGVTDTPTTDGETGTKSTADTSPVSDTRTASPAAGDAGNPANSAPTATADTHPTDADASDQPVDSERNETESDSVVRTTGGIDETPRHPTPVALQIREHLTEDGRRHVFRAATVDGEPVQLDVWNRHVDAFDWEPGAWYEFESVRGQHWTVDGESGVTVSTTPDVTVTRRDSTPESDVKRG